MASLPLYYEGNSLEDMERKLRNVYLKQSGWLESAETKLALRDGAPVPWFTYSAIAFLEKNVPDYAKVFEYGGGQSTLYWANRVKTVVGIDHDPSFVEHVNKTLPDNATFSVVEEGSTLSSVIQKKLQGKPDLLDPERDEKTYRSGQLNNLFENYALQLLAYRNNEFDVVVIDGMARVLSTWAAIKHFKRDGFIVFDNSDRSIYDAAYAMLENAGYRRVDFWGLGPINPYEWCTSVFYKSTPPRRVSWFPDPAKKNVKSQALDELGILVLGYNRPHHLQAVLESLRLQDALDRTHVWLDGTHGRGELLGANDKARQIAERYQVKQLQQHNGHLGIEKMMLDGLDHMTSIYDRVLVLEDDCFPVSTCVVQFEIELADVKGRDDIYSVYGHPFGTESSESTELTRFQGWGWAAHSRQIRTLLPELRRLFSMNEFEYLNTIQSRMNDDIVSRLDCTPGRDVLNVLRKSYSWDSATSFLCAERKKLHRRTRQRSIYNNGITPGIGHFRQDNPKLRQPPFNMITLDESWGVFDQTTTAADKNQDSYGLDELDKKIMEIVPDVPGFFVELGAFDGVTQCNSILLEKVGWKGLLIEANPGSYAKCVKSRPDCLVEQVACVGADYQDTYIEIVDVGLMSLTPKSEFDTEQKEEWLERGEGFAKRARQTLEVPATTLSKVLDKHRIDAIDLLLLDVEGAEVDVLKGIDFSRHAPRQIVAEDAYSEGVREYLAQFGYGRTKVLLERKNTRDCLYEK